MNSSLALKSIVAGATLFAASSAIAVDITAIMGTDIQKDNWTATLSGNLQLGLRAKNRGDVSPAFVVPVPVGSTYYFGSGTDGARGPFNYEFSITTDYYGVSTEKLSAYNFYLKVDRDPTAGINWVTVNPLSYWYDNSYGNFGTGQSAGVEPASLADYLNFPGIYSIAQNSQNITFGGATGYPGGALAEVADATYNYELYATNQAGQRVASVGITVVTGNGGAAVPDSGTTVAFVGLALAGLVGLRRRFSR